MLKKFIMGLSLFLFCLIITSASVDVNASKELDELKQREEAQVEKQKALDQKRKELAIEKKAIEGEYNQVETNIEETDELITTTYDSIKELELDKVDLELKIDELENQLEGKRIDIAKVHVDLQTTLQDKEVANSKARERIRVMYEYGDVGFLEVLFDSGDLIEMFNRMEYINRLVEADNAIFASLSDYEADILAKKAELEVHEATLVEMSNDVELEKTELQDMVDSKNLLVANAMKLKETQEQTQEELEATLEQKQKLDDQFEQAMKAADAEMNNIMAAKAAQIQKENGFTYSGGEMTWPVQGWYRISSEFGPRFHPIHKEMRNHDGIDIPASAGTPIVAAKSGEVIISKYNVGYGNYVAIAHGNGYITLYAHCSKRLVNVGDPVAEGQKIAEVGSTGWSTGNHLHFGVKLNDQWVNPLPYVQ